VRSNIKSYLTLSYYCVYRTSVFATEAFLAMDSLTAVESLISLLMLLTIFLSSVRVFYIFLIST